MMKKYFLLTLVLAWELSANDGTLDATFNPTGTPPGTFVTTDQFGTNPSTANAVVVRYDDKIVLGGAVSTEEGDNFALLILNADGTVYAKDGSVHAGVAGSIDGIFGLAVQPDLKIIAAGKSAASIGYPSQFVVARYCADGTLDNAFGNAGITIVDFLPIVPGPGPISAEAFAVALLRDGRIVVVGRAQETTGELSPYFFAVAVLKQDGTLDTSFASGTGRRVYGSALIPQNTSSIADAVAIQSIGLADNIILAGQGVLIGPDPNTFQIVRILPNGDLDLGFATNGVDIVPFDPFTSKIATGVDIYPDGRIVAVGTQTAIEEDAKIVVTRRLVNGGADNTFNATGSKVITLGDNAIRANALNIQNNLKILIAGGYDDGENQGFIAYRLEELGDLDASFNGQGFSQQSFGEFSAANAIALQPNGKIVLVGQAEDNQQTAALRYLNNNLSDEVFIEPIFTSPADNLGNCSENPPTLEGTAQNPSNITLYANGTEIGRTITIGSTNTWSLIPAMPLEQGSNTFQVVAEYKSGNMNATAISCCGIGLGPQSCISKAIRKKYCPLCADVPINSDCFRTT